jgi:PAS domain S-box-containing protein
MPLVVGERVIGVISVESEKPDAFSSQDERLLATLANQAAVAFENARLYQEVQQELSKRERAQEALHTSETHYRQLADSITDIFFELDQNFHYSHWNKTYELLTGVTASEAIGKSMREIFGDSEEQIRIEMIYREVLEKHTPKTFETVFRLNGQPRAFEINAYPSTRGVSVVAKDVTDRKRSEIVLQKRFELMEYSAHHSLDDLMRQTTDEVSELTGSEFGFFHFMEDDQSTPGTQIWSTNALKLSRLPASEGGQLSLDQAGAWADAARQRRSIIQNDYETLSHRKNMPDGQIKIVREMVIPIIRDEKIKAVVGLANKQQEYTQQDLETAERFADYAWDITERKRMEMDLADERTQLAKRVEERTAELIKANSNLARALRVKDEFLANMSHELRTPLNAILGLSESLAEQIAGPLNEKQLKYITTIGESGHHLLSLINDILDLAKIEAGQITLDVTRVDINAVCQASLRMVKQLAQKKNQDILLEIDSSIGLIWADERRLKQMIVNLLSNAVKFTSGNGKIGLDVHGYRDENRVDISVWDNGIGISDDGLSHLFQPFVQLDSGLARETAGTGLGLALVSQMARLHGGSISVHSEPGKGSRFTVRLPWEPAAAEIPIEKLHNTGKLSLSKTDPENKKNILLVEDTMEVTMMLKDYLETAGYNVSIAQDGIEGIEQAKRIHPDLILMDVQMPRMDGIETTKRLRDDPKFKYVPIIALTAQAMPSDRERCIEAGMNEYITKPVNLRTLVKVIHKNISAAEERTRPQ